MKLKIEIDEALNDDEIILKCKEINEEVLTIQRSILSSAKSRRLELFKDETTYYIPLEQVLFFESSERQVNAHTQDDIYMTKLKLYELEDILPKFFVRVSKSALVNVNHVCSIEKHITGASTVGFFGTHKKIFVSRMYLKSFTSCLHERRYIYEKQ